MLFFKNSKYTYLLWAAGVMDRIVIGYSYGNQKNGRNKREMLIKEMHNYTKNNVFDLTTF